MQSSRQLSVERAGSWGNLVKRLMMSTAYGVFMKRFLVLCIVAGFILAQVGCTATCKKMFGLDRRCDTPPPPPPPQQFTAPPPMVTGPANYSPEPCPCNTPK